MRYTRRDLFGARAMMVAAQVDRQRRERRSCRSHSSCGLYVTCARRTWPACSMR